MPKGIKKRAIQILLVVLLFLLFSFGPTALSKGVKSGFVTLLYWSVPLTAYGLFKIFDYFFTKVRKKLESTRAWASIGYYYFRSSRNWSEDELQIIRDRWGNIRLIDKISAEELLKIDTVSLKNNKSD